MEEGLNIIGDVAGQYKTLLALLGKMPNSRVLLLGDLVDRGPNSRKVVSFVRRNPDYISALLGNHEHMMIDFALMGPDRPPLYEDRIWIINGGGATIKSYLPNTKAKEMTLCKIQDALFADAKWMEGLPLFHVEPGLFVSHAPVTDLSSIEHPGAFDFCWNRAKPWRQSGRFIVHGHNSDDRVRWYRADDVQGPHQEVSWGINIDTSRAKVLTGIHWPTKALYSQEYID